MDISLEFGHSSEDHGKDKFNAGGGFGSLLSSYVVRVVTDKAQFLA